MGISEVILALIASLISGLVGYYFGKKQYKHKLKVDAYIEFVPFIRELERLLKVTTVYPNALDVKTLAINNRDREHFLKGNYEKVREKFIYCFGDEYKSILDELEKKLIEHTSSAERERSEDDFKNHISANTEKLYKAKDKI